MIALGFVNHPLHDFFVRGNELSAWTMEYLHSGRIHVETPQGQKCHSAPSFMMIPPHTPYRVTWSGEAGPWTEIYAIFDAPRHWNHLLQWPLAETRLGFLDLPDSATSQEIENGFKEALQTSRSTRTNRQALTLNTLERVLLLLDEINPRHGHAQRDARIEQTVSFIAENYGQTLDLETLSRRVFLSPSRFSHLFKEQIGVAPMAYLEQYRLECAAEKLLASHHTIEQIASEAGFANSFHFSTRFRKQFGRAPSQYRRNPK